MGKKVLIVATVGGFLPQFEGGNVSLLQSMGAEVHYAANFEAPFYRLDEEELRQRGIVLHPLAISKHPAHVLSHLRAVRVLRELIDRESIDLVHCHTPMGGVTARLAAALSRRKPKVIYTAHGFHFYRGAPVVNWLLYYPAERLLARMTDCIVTINREDLERAKTFHLRPGGCCVQIPGVGLRPLCTHPGRDVRRELGIPADAFHLVSVGELNRNKNHEIVIRALAKLERQDVYYTLCGTGPAEQALAALIGELGLGSRVRLVGYRDDVADIYAAADCAAFPSVREGLGMAALEAMACGVPVIAADNRGTREYMRHGENGLVCCYDSAQQFDNAIRILADDRDLRLKMGEAARETARRFSGEFAAGKMQVIYSNVLR